MKANRNLHANFRPLQDQVLGLRGTVTIRFLVAIAAFSILVAACAKPEPAPAKFPLGQLLNEIQPPTGWTLDENPKTFSPDTLYDLVNGQADSYFAYGFRQAALARYHNSKDEQFQIQVFELAGTSDAYGLFSVSASGLPVEVGAAGDTDPGRRLAFWQDRFFVVIIAPRGLDEAQLLGVGQAISEALPAGGQTPEMVNYLPPSGLVNGSQRFFHEEMSIQSWLWLGGSNILQLGPGTDGVLAQYERNGARATLLLVEYPASKQARAAHDALQQEPPAGLLASAVTEQTLVAVFGDLDLDEANGLLGEVKK